MTRSDNAVDAGRLKAAWQNYEAAMARIRDAFVSSRLMQLAPEDAEGAYRCIAQAQAHAQNLIIAPHPDRPVFYFNTLFDPFSYTWLAPCPDFFYRMAFVNGSGKYRIRVRRNDATWINFHIRSDMWGMPGVQYLGSSDLDDFTPDGDGWTQIIASAERQVGNWLPLDRSSKYNFFNVRAALEDWIGGTPPEFHIDVVEKPSDPIVPGAVETARRLERAAHFVEFSALNYSIKANEDAWDRAGGLNTFGSFTGATFQNAGNSPRNNYAVAMFEIQPDEALILELTAQDDARYWGMMLGDVWGNTLNYYRHQTCLNASQGLRDPDDIARFVVSHQDPGVPNWLDTAGHIHGIVQSRAHGSSNPIQCAARLVPLADVRKHLPKGTPQVTAAERATMLRKRERAIVRLYGF